jgi:hypothetical protein
MPGSASLSGPARRIRRVCSGARKRAQIECKGVICGQQGVGSPVRADTLQCSLLSTPCPPVLGGLERSALKHPPEKGVARQTRRPCNTGAGIIALVLGFSSAQRG